VLGEGSEGLSGRRLAGQSRQQSASSGLVRRLLNRYQLNCSYIRKNRT